MQNQHFQIHRFVNKEEAVVQTAKKINEILTSLRVEKKPVLLLLSGGSALDLLNYIDEKNLADKLTIAVLDERYSTDEVVNNFMQVTKTPFYAAAKKNGVNVIETAVKTTETSEQLAKRFQTDLKVWKETNTKGEILAIVGIGPDGHTSGMLPFSENPELFAELFENPEKLVVNYDAEGKNPFRYRVTTTNTFMRDYIDHAVVYAVGENKRDALARLMAESGSLANTPARILREMKHVDLFTDVIPD